MKLTIDKTADSLYLDLSEGEIAETRQVAPGVMLDYDAEGKALGIEMLSLSKRTGRLDLDNFLYQTRGVVAGG